MKGLLRAAAMIAKEAPEASFMFTGSMRQYTTRQPMLRRHVQRTTSGSKEARGRDQHSKQKHEQSKRQLAQEASTAAFRPSFTESLHGTTVCNGVETSISNREHHERRGDKEK